MRRETPAATEGSAPAFDPAAFRRCLGEFATGVTIVTAVVDGEPVGVTANSFSSLSLDPPLVLWSIGHTSRSLSGFQRATHFAINVLALEQVKLSQRFSSKETDKFANVPWRPGLYGLPLMESALATLECERETLQDAGDHVLLIGRVRRFHRRDGRPLLFAQGRYGAAAEHPDLEVSQYSATISPPESDAGEMPFTTLLAQVHHALESDFEEQRQAEGVTLTEHKVLMGLFDQPPISANDLAKRIYFGQRELEDAMGELQRRGFVRSEDGMLTLTPAGRERRIRIMDRTRTVDRKRLGLSEQEVIAVKSALRKLQTHYQGAKGRL